MNVKTDFLNENLSEEATDHLDKVTCNVSNREKRKPTSNGNCVIVETCIKNVSMIVYMVQLN